MGVRGSASHCWPAVRVRSSGQSHLYWAKQPDRPKDRTLMAGQQCEADPRTPRASHFRPLTSAQRVQGGRPWEAKHGLSPQSHVICVGGRIRPLTFDRPLTHTGRSNAFSCEISQTAPRIGLPCPVCVRSRSKQCV